MLGKKNPNKGVKVVVEEGKVFLDIFVLIHQDMVIPEVAWKVQENVKNSVESMTGLKVEEVNVHVQGILFKKDLIKEEK